MYPSNSYYASNNNNNDNLMSPYYTLDQTLANKPSIFEINPNSKSEDPLTSSFYNIPSPFYHYENNIFDQHMYEFNLQQQSQLIEVNAPNTISSDMGEHSDNVEDVLGESSSKHNESEVIKEIPKTRTSKKDRHSKIETAQGPRDRRMRLSLQVARPFFDLQDMLGYNKASKTVEWLLSKSKSAIQDLTKSSTHSPSSTSECEVVSQEKGIPLVSPTKEAKTNPRGSTRKSAFNPLTKESREKARARARERTIEKRKGDSSKNCFETTTSHQMDQLESWCRNGSNGCHFQELGNVGEPSSSAIFNYHTHENRTFEEHHFIDFDLYGKPWDAYNNTNLR